MFSEIIAQYVPAPAFLAGVVTSQSTALWVLTIPSLILVAGMLLYLRFTPDP